MSLKDLNARIAAIDERRGEPTQQKVFEDKPFKNSGGFVKRKIKKRTIAEAERVARARKGGVAGDVTPVETIHTPKPSNPLKKIERAACRLADLMTGQDLEHDLRVIREAKDATHRFFDIKAKEFIEVPDHKTRLAAVALSRAYTEGLPVARQVQITAEIGGMDDALEKLRASPAARALLEALYNDFQKKGGEKESNASE